MEYPNSKIVYCSNDHPYRLYEDGTGVCSQCLDDEIKKSKFRKIKSSCMRDCLNCSWKNCFRVK